MSDLLAKALSDALSLATEQDSTYGYSDEPGSPYVLLLAAALRNHPDRLRIAVDLLTAEDVTDALTTLPQADWDPCMAASVDDVASRILAALSGEHSDD
jgi:hypothetical protein